MQTLISQETLQQRVTGLARGSRSTIRTACTWCVLKGAFMFLADLVRTMTCEVTLDFMAVSSYGPSTRSSGQVRLLEDLDSGWKSRSVVIVEDIVDTGADAGVLQEILRARGPDLKTACLLSKPSRRLTNVTVDYVRFTIDDLFVVGYGLDSGGTPQSSPSRRRPRRQRLVAGRFTAARTLSAHDRASATTAASSSVSTFRSRISTLPFTIVFRTSSP